MRGLGQGGEGSSRMLNRPCLSYVCGRTCAVLRPPPPVFAMNEKGSSWGCQKRQPNQPPRSLLLHTLVVCFFVVRSFLLTPTRCALFDPLPSTTRVHVLLSVCFVCRDDRNLLATFSNEGLLKLWKS